MDEEMIQLLRKIFRARYEYYEQKERELKKDDPIQRMMYATSACDYATMELMLYYAAKGDYEAVRQYDYF